jgi:hypothetical protein
MPLQNVSSVSSVLPMGAPIHPVSIRVQAIQLYSCFTHRERVVRTPCSPTLSSMRRLPGMLGHLQLSPPAMPVTQEPLLSSSCFQQGYHNAPHGAHRAGEFPRTRLSVLRSFDPFWTLSLQGLCPVLQVYHALAIPRRRFGIFRST